MWAFRARLERLSQVKYREMEDARHLILILTLTLTLTLILTLTLSQVKYREMEDARRVLDRIHNCQVLHYTR